MDNNYKPSLVQVYLVAKSRDEVIRLQWLNNIQNEKNYNYSTPVKEGDEWIVWYYADILTDRPLNMSEDIKKPLKPKEVRSGS